MAKTKKEKPSEKATARLQQRYYQTRDAQLRQWYAEAQSDDADIRTSAQLRLQLQIWMREKRKELMALKLQRDVCRRDEDIAELEKVKKKLKSAHCAQANYWQVIQGKIQMPNPEKVLNQWAKKPCTLQQILGDEDLDKKNDFGVAFEVQDFAASDEEGGVDIDRAMLKQEESHEGAAIYSDGNNSIEAGLKEVKSWAESKTGSLMHKAKPVVTDPHNQEVAKIWEQHETRMLRHFRAEAVSESVVQAVLTTHRVALEQHALYEHMTTEERKKTKMLAAKNMVTFNNQHIRLCSTPNPELACPIQGTWSLVSTKLWAYFDGGGNWNSPNWLPGGQMHIKTVSGLSRICLKFNTRLFRTEAVRLPGLTDPCPLAFKALCEETSTEVLFSITFLTNGFLEVQFPTLPIVQSDARCKILPTLDAVVVLVGVYMGANEQSEEMQRLETLSLIHL